MARQAATFEEATPPQSGFVRASEAAALMEKQRKLNGSKKPAYIPKSVIADSKKTQLYIFNVGPKRLEGSGASYGAMMIPACAPDQEFSNPLIIPGTPYEYYNFTGNRLEAQFHGEDEMEDPGFDFACQVIGGFTKENGQFEGKFLSPKNSLERFGVGISREWPPAAKDVATARKKMLREYAVMVQEANEAEMVGKFSSLGNAEDYFVAARALGKTEKDCRWMARSADPGTTKALCPYCHTPTDAPKCPTCREVIDPVGYEAVQARLAKK